MNKEKMKKEVEEFSKLEKNWDGYGSLPLKEELINKINYVIDHLDDENKDPHITPEPCGVGLEWHSDENSLLISIDENSITYSQLDIEDLTDGSYGYILADEINKLLEKFIK